MSCTPSSFRRQGSTAVKRAYFAADLAETVSTNLSNAVTQPLKAFGYRRPYRYANNDLTSTGEMSRPPQKHKERAYPDLPP